MRSLTVPGRGRMEGTERAGLRLAVGGAVLLLVLNALDVLTTGVILHRHGGVEANPLSAWLLAHGLLLVTKAALVSVVGFLAWLAARRPWLLRALWAVTGAYVLVVASNAAQLLR